MMKLEIIQLKINRGVTFIIQNLLIWDYLMHLLTIYKVYYE